VGEEEGCSVGIIVDVETVEEVEQDGPAVAVAEGEVDSYIVVARINRRTLHQVVLLAARLFRQSHPSPGKQVKLSGPLQRDSRD
jgi:hypothetical protein